MQRTLIRYLESFLAGELGTARRREFEARLGHDRKSRATVAAMREISGLFETLDLPDGAPTGPRPGFAANVMAAIRQESRPSLWDSLQQPLFLRRVAFAAFGWLFLLASANVWQSNARAAASYDALAVLASPAASTAYCGVRLGCDLDLNRNTMLAAVMVSGRVGR